MPVTGASGCKVSTRAAPGQAAERICRMPVPAEGRRSGRLRNTDLKVGKASAVLISYWNELVRGVIVVIGLSSRNKALLFTPRPITDSDLRLAAEYFHKTGF